MAKRRPRSCSQPDCASRHYAMDLCRTHWYEHREAHPELHRAKRAQPAADLFWAKVDKTTSPIGCWLWTGPLDWKGYGIATDGVRTVRAPRYAYELLVGPIPEGKQLDHLCHTRDKSCIGICIHRRCVRPSHLEPVTPLENNQRGNMVGRTHCVHGHEYTPDNTRWQERGSGRRPGRACIACEKARDKRRWQETLQARRVP